MSTSIEPRQVSKKSVVTFITVVDRDNDGEVTLEDIQAFIQKQRMPFKAPTLAAMFEEAAVNSPSGRLRLVDIRQAVGFRRERVKLPDAPSPIHGAKSSVEWRVKERPFRAQWLLLIQTAVGGPEVFVPPLFTSVAPKKHGGRRPPSRTGTPVGMRIRTDLSADVAVARNLMIHGARADNDARVASVGAVAGVGRRRAVEARLNQLAASPTAAAAAASPATTPRTDEDGNPASPGVPLPPPTPVQTYTFRAAAGFTDVGDTLSTDSIAEGIRSQAAREVEARVRASTPLSELGLDPATAMPAAKLNAVRRDVIKAASAGPSMDLRPPARSRTPVVAVSELFPRPVRRTVSGNRVDDESSSDDDGDDGDDVVQRAVARAAADAHAEAQSTLYATGSTRGMSTMSVFTNTLGSTLGSTAQFPTLSPTNLAALDAKRPQATPGRSSPLTVSVAPSAATAVTKASRVTTVSASASTLSAVQPRTRARIAEIRAAKTHRRRAKQLLQSLRRSGSTGGIATMAQTLLGPKARQGKPGAPPPFRIGKPKTQVEELTEVARMRRDMKGAWSKPREHEFRQPFVALPGHEDDDAFGLTKRSLTRAQLSKELDAVALQKVSLVAEGPEQDARLSFLAHSMHRPRDFTAPLSGSGDASGRLGSRPPLARPATTDGASAGRRFW